ncbi:hypothetical protein M0804_004688 [Polistes exclamans]|nr:hypothetical protein M0804_004688 [Polistes exclamans]
METKFILHLEKNYDSNVNPADEKKCKASYSDMENFWLLSLATSKQIFEYLCAFLTRSRVFSVRKAEQPTDRPTSQPTSQPTNQPTLFDVSESRILTAQP